ncbi:MAG: hypothetical protein VXY34_10125 [Bdellovibrionota bacterium]|nr:hypothetical protein [Bdellovibrionota bacterium]MEC8625165.1 hypothetical protein [Bdellovibrionota bacterium]|tara:strand:- start:24035 stop:25288 length:1254 start_codon:yes stop_codon:yes gene_type:complete
MTTKRILLSSLLLASQVGYAGMSNMKAPTDLPSAMVMPKGVRSLKLLRVSAGPTKNYDNVGDEKFLGDAMKKEVTYSEILKTKKGIDKAGIKGAMASISGHNLDTVLMTTQGQVNIKADVTVPVFVWGVTEKWTLGFALPITKQSTNVDTGVEQTSELVSLKKYLATSGGVPNTANKLVSDTMNPVAKSLADKGFAPLKNETTTKMGDLKIINKLRVFKNDKNMVTLGGELTLPTGEERTYVNKLVDSAGGDGQTDLAIGVNHDFKTMKYLTLSSGLKYTVQFKDNFAGNVPENGSPISDLIDYNMDRDLGNEFEAAVAGTFNYRGAKLGLGYFYKNKEKDEYTGSKYDAANYEEMGKDTDQVMHSLLAKVGYDTITLFKEKKFPIPLSVSLTQSFVPKGKNVIADDMTTFDFSMFF